MGRTHLPVDKARWCSKLSNVPRSTWSNGQTEDQVTKLNDHFAQRPHQQHPDE
jgi:hypothetical protein